MEKNLYIDASNPEETRIVLKSDNLIEEYEFENKNNLNFNNNIYLVKINRIDQTAGIMRFSDKEQEAYLDVGRNYNIEIFFALGPRSIYDISASKFIHTPWGHASALRTRGMEQVIYAMEDAKRITRMGGRGLLISDEGLLILCKKMRDHGELPPDTKLMASAHLGHNNPVTYKM